MELIFILTAEGPFIFHDKNGGAGGIFLFFGGAGHAKKYSVEGKGHKKYGV